MSGPDYIYANGDDWRGLYANGELIEQGHEIDWFTFIAKELAPQAGFTFKQVNVDLDWMAENRYLPEDPSDIVEERQCP